MLLYQLVAKETVELSIVIDSAVLMLHVLLEGCPLSTVPAPPPGALRLTFPSGWDCLDQFAPGSIKEDGYICQGRCSVGDFNRQTILFKAFCSNGTWTTDPASLTNACPQEGM